MTSSRTWVKLKAGPRLLKRAFYIDGDGDGEGQKAFSPLSFCFAAAVITTCGSGHISCLDRNCFAPAIARASTAALAC